MSVVERRLTPSFGPGGFSRCVESHAGASASGGTHTHQHSYQQPSNISSLRRAQRPAHQHTARKRSMHPCPITAAANAAPSAASAGGRRRVRWQEDTKQHDGLEVATNAFHEYMRDVFRTVARPNGETTVSVLAQRLNVHGLLVLRSMLADLMQRCQQSARGRAAILNRGGGSLGSVTTAHLPYLKTHVEYLDTVVGKVRAVKARMADAHNIRARRQREKRMRRDVQPTLLE